MRGFTNEILMSSVGMCADSRERLTIWVSCRSISSKRALSRSVRMGFRSHEELDIDLTIVHISPTALGSKKERRLQTGQFLMEAVQIPQWIPVVLLCLIEF